MVVFSNVSIYVDIMQTTYFLFGKEASEIVIDEGIDAFINSLEDNIDFELYEFNSNSNPASFLASFKNWNEYVVLSKEEFDRLKESLI